MFNLLGVGFILNPGGVAQVVRVCYLLQFCVCTMFGTSSQDWRAGK